MNKELSLSSFNDKLKRWGRNPVSLIRVTVVLEKAKYYESICTAWIS